MVDPLNTFIYLHLFLFSVGEIYTDKDRAAAVTMGDRDIKTSLKVINCSSKTSHHMVSAIANVLTM